jgi:hypothetical protein
MKTLNQIKVLLLITATTVLFSNCSKDRIEEKQLNNYDSMNDYFNSKKQQEQVFTIDTTGSGPIIGNQGTKIWVSKEKLMFSNGDSVHWPYTVRLIELYTPKDMIYYQMPTVASGSLLTTGGEVRVRAFKNGQELLLRPNKTWTVEMPSQQPLPGMSIYYGVVNSTFTNWVPNPVGAFNTTTYGYTGDIATLGWVGCGKIAINTGSFTSCAFTSTTDNLQNVATFLYFPTLKSLMQAYNQTSGNEPVGKDVKIILMGINSSHQLYYYYQQTQVSANFSANVTLTSISDAALTTILDSL